MIIPKFLHQGQEFWLALLMLAQGVCAVFFVFDVLGDFANQPDGNFLPAHLTLELFANIGLIAGIVVEGFVLRRMLQRQAQHEKALSVAAGALNDLMQDHFRGWGLTPAEADVAAFTIKGFSIAEIAQLRNAAEGTVKSQLNAIYRKSGLAGRGQLVSILIEDLLQGPLPDRDMNHGVDSNAAEESRRAAAGSR
jgi:DNA-binding CsgD family transcriptional regulator